MACRGVFFSIDDDQAGRIEAAQGDDALMEIVAEIEEAWDHEHLAECDKSWDAMHRLLADGSLEWNAGSYPLNQVVLGDPSLHVGPDYLVCLKDAPCLKDIAAAIQNIDREQLKSLYFVKVPKDYALGVFGDEDFEYTWENFKDVRDFYQKAANENRSVIFTVDQ